MRRTIRWLCTLACLLGCSRASPEKQAPAAEPTAEVEVAPLKRRSVTETLTVYGTVVSGPAGHGTLSVPYETRVVRMLVRAGQQLPSGAPVLEVEPSADSRLALKQAAAAVESTQESFKAVQQNFASHLATNLDFEQAEQAQRAAQMQLASLTQRGSGRARTLLSPGPSIVSAVQVSEGALVPPGGTFVELDFSDHREVRFGLEAEDVSHIETASLVQVTDLELPPVNRVAATVRAVSNAVNDQTRLVDLFAALPIDAPFMLGQRVMGQLSIVGRPGLVIARSALLPVEDHLVVFTVANNQAVSHAVRLGLETAGEVELIASDLSENEPVVVQGALVLQSGMPVHVKARP